MINWFDMPAEGLSNGGEFEIKELTATENKVYETPGEVYNKVTVNVEGGGSSVSGLITDTDGVLDKSYNEIIATINSGVLPFIFLNGIVYFLSQDVSEVGDYFIRFDNSIGEPERRYAGNNPDGLLEYAAD